MFEYEGKEYPSQGMLLGLDELYDTRLGVLDNVHTSLGVMALQDGYLERVEDVFPMIDKATFLKLYAVRDAEVLARSLPTRILEVVKDFMKTTVKQALDTPFSVGSVIYINTWPYQMTKEEAQLIVKPMWELGDGRVDVHAVNWPLADITPAWVRRNLSLLVMYRYDEWLEIHTLNDNLRMSQLPDVTLLGPKLYWNRPPNQEEQSEFNTLKKTAFEVTELQASGIIGLQLVDPYVFSAEIPAQALAQIMASKPVKS